MMMALEPAANFEWVFGVRNRALSRVDQNP
jgi:hypothetical protein